MKIRSRGLHTLTLTGAFLVCGASLTPLAPFARVAHADLTLTSGSNATTTPNVATAITGFQIVGPAASTTPVKLLTTSGTLSMTTTTGLTFNGSSSGSTIYFSGTVANINAALATLKYTRASTGTDTLEVSLVNSGEVFFTTNNHLYKFVAGSFTWDAAKAAAEAQTAYGVAGYLATITSQAENDFVSGRLTGDGWLGGSDAAVEGDWRWVTGPEAGTLFWRGIGNGSAQGGNYAHWNSGEPNQSGNEDCAETYVASGSWNDLDCGSQLGYVAEFGSGTSTPTVVAKNISIVTADVPAITSLSPANGAINVGTSTNLVIGFSKAVTQDTGTILIKKTSDDTTVESIVASSSQITGNGTNTITIDPSITLQEGVGYYVLLPGTAFKDGSSNHFDGISLKTTWAFSVPDLTAPVITGVTASSTAATTSSIVWTTNEVASSRVVYSAGTTYASSTAETDASPRVTSHTMSLSSLAACTSYNFKVVSADASANYATSTASSFTTLGCAGGAAPTSATTTSVTVNATSTTSAIDTGRTLTVSTPANFTATTTSVVIQVKGMSADAVLASIGIPHNLSSAASVVFDVKALINNNTTLDSFDAPVTISYAYTDADVAGLNENSLSMYHYHNGVWLPLDNCTVDTTANTITCSTPSFSTFAIFGSPLVAAVTSTQSASHRTGSSITEQVSNLIAMGKTADATALKAQWPALFPVATAYSSTSSASPALTVRDLKNGSVGNDVLALQKFLNANGYVVATAGAGSAGSETTSFAARTRSALAKFQSANAITPAVGYFGPVTRAKISALGLTGAWW
ncbi:hypothetical protein BH11PAT2_BH11PAT2_01170 [soil metagenome]